MAEQRNFPHIVVENSATTEAYRYPGGGGSEKALPPRDRQNHANRLLAALERVRTDAAERKEELNASAVPAKKGVHVVFESEPGFELELKSLEDRRQGIELVALHPSRGKEDAQLAVVHVPQGKLEAFERKIEEYATRETVKGKPRNNKLVEKIADIRLADPQELLDGP